MELGGKSPIIVFDDADIVRAVNVAMLGNFCSSGQICSNGTRVFVHEAIHDAFVARVKQVVFTIKIGNPLDPDVQYGPMVSNAQMQIALDFVQIGLPMGAMLEWGGQPLDPPDPPEGFFASPAVFTSVTDIMRIAQEEILVRSCLFSSSLAKKK